MTAPTPLNLIGECRILGPHHHAFVGPHRFNAATPTPDRLTEAQRFLTPMYHLPARHVGDPDDMPRCVACGFLLTPRRGHQRECAVGAYLAALATRPESGEDDQTAADWNAAVTDPERICPGPEPLWDKITGFVRYTAGIEHGPCIDADELETAIRGYAYVGPSRSVDAEPVDADST